jgi:putative membrane protein
MHLLKAFHVIAMVTWFAGLFYLPRLFVYHATCHDEPGNQRFKVMEHKLYYYITTPGAILTTALGLFLFFVRFEHYSQASWIYIKFMLVALLWVFHFYCGYWLKQFKRDANPHSERFYRIINEIPTLILISVVILSFVKPW